MQKFALKFKAAKFWSLAELFSINLWFVTIFLVSSGITRLILIFLNVGELRDAFFMIPASMLVGTFIDLFVAAYISTLISLSLLILPARWRSLTGVRWITSIAGFLFIFGNLYLGVAEIIFFDEFSSRFNYVAVDYLIYPHEVFINIWDTYPVLSIIVSTALISLLLTWLISKSLYRGVLAYPTSFRSKSGIVLALGFLVVLLPLTVGAKFSKISDNRILNEITLNGIYTFFYAGITNELDYDQYYKTIDSKAALMRLRELLDDDHTTFLFDDSANTICRHITSDRPLHRFNIVLVLEESFGSNFVGTLYPEGPNLTPRFDSLIQKGMFFSNIYATGNRTVRGVEASLASFPPIPGRSIVKRPGSKNMFTLPSVLKGLDYNTVFLYGGLSYFDNFEHFASNNGFDLIVDEMDIKEPEFSTIWGVSDEDLFSHALTVFDSLYERDNPFFATIITVSNHSPYTYPAGRIPFDPEDRRRENAVRYADYAIGKFIEDARSHSMFDSTLFIFLADHGARVYGSEEIPLRSYEIPVLFYNPKLIPTGETVGIIGSQMDLAPTILDFLGIEYNSMFFGRSLLSVSAKGAPVLMSHNRDVSLLKNDTLIVLDIQGGEQIWYKDTTGHFRPAADKATSPLVADAISYYMTAYRMFKAGQLHPLDQSTVDR